mmetsp:Transcript_98204/g.204830  ORF Transcript_98204/g.204830 Transcript_98204/m.204830 type:complete len:455 (-) Transcript_98204:139-1503(-)
MIVGVDQVLLDLVVQVDDDLGVFDRFGLTRNSQCLAEPRHGPLLDELLARAEDEAAGGSSLVRKSPGGVVPNSLRAAAHTLQTLGFAGPRPELKMFGIVNKDSSGERLREELQRAGVQPMFTTTAGISASGMAQRTGVCCCLIAGKERTMLTELGVGRSMVLDGTASPDCPSFSVRMKTACSTVVAAAGPSQASKPVLIVISAFYAQADPDGARAIVSWCKQQKFEKAGKVRPTIALAASAEWCCGIPVVQELAQKADFLFANQPEIEELARQLRSAGKIREDAKFSAKDGGAVDHDLASEEAVIDIARWKPHGWVIATRGSKSVAFLKSGSSEQATLVPVPRLPPDEFVDDVGAGDSFMGGFLVTAWQTMTERAGLSEDPPACKSLLETVYTCCTSRQHREPILLDKDELATALQEDPAGTLLSAADIEAACLAGITTAGACLRCVGCQFPKV